MVLVLIVCLVVASGVQGAPLEAEEEPITVGAPLEAEDKPSTMPPQLFNLVEDQDYIQPPKLTPEQERIAILHAALNARKGKSGGYGRRRRAPVEITDSVNAVTGVEVKNHGERGQAQLDLQHGKPFKMQHGRRNKRAPVKITDSVIAVTGVEIKNHGERGQTQLDHDHAKPIEMKHGRRKRNPQEELDDQIAMETNNDAKQTGEELERDCSGLVAVAKYLCEVGPTTIERSPGYGRRKRSPIEFKFIPFHENEANKVNTLRIEQNDFMAERQRRQDAETVQAQVTEVHLPSLVNQKQA